ncbi:trimethylamine methyltransferase family protein [Eubacterium sp. 1001713B170207_170306_E7]|uniref:trimethylamine methyltransferase family protein n=1 Tax=Eubacterium sp. 1001713B170207_170306_E7 TaxID=2787097 RepID=UPI00189B129F|nr:trimethylamine methyltransferase family protein [Eubacterium sp. 1001713B170207_170306_E7]
MKLRYSFSEKEECQQIHEYSLDILENTGIVVHSEKARSTFKRNGAKLEGKKVYLPPKIVEDRLVDVPSSFTFNTPGHRVTVGGGTTCTMPPYGATYAKKNNISHLAGREDFINFTKLSQESGQMSMACPYVLEPMDVPIDFRENYKMAMCLKYSDKPTFSMTQDGRSARESIRFAQKFWDCQDSHLLIGNINISAPLIMGEGTADVILVHGEENQPLMVACGSGLSGLTAPPLPTSNFLISNAAVLAGIVLAQMVRPGLPIVYGFPLFGVNPFNADASPGEPTTALFTMAAAEMGRFYEIPTRSGGVFTDSRYLDYQSGAESFMNLFSCLFSGVDCIMHAFGMEDALNTINYNKYILDEALYDTVTHYLNGFEVNAVTLMKDAIKETGCTDNYINMSNLRLIRKHYHPYPFKNTESEHTILEASDAIVHERLENYTAPPLTQAQQKLIEGCLPREFID